MIVEVPKQRWRRPTLVAMAGVGVMAAIGLVLWSVPPAISNISSRRYADAVEVGTRVVLVVVAVVLVGAALDRERRRWWWWAAATLGVLIGLTAVVLLVWLAPPALYKNITPEKDRASAEAVTRTGLIAGLAGLAALGGLAMTARTYRLTEQGQITDRYTKAIEQLGDNKLDIRLGGIYGLERIAHDSKRDHPTVVEVLRTFVSEHSRPRPSRSRLSHSTERIATDVQAAIDVLLRLPDHPGLPEAQLDHAHLPKARLGGATLTRAVLGGATLTRAVLGGATLTDANLGGATLTDANLIEATLTRAQLGGSPFFGITTGADLTTAKGLTQRQLDAAHGDEDTKLSAGLQRPAHWSAGLAEPAADQ